MKHVMAFVLGVITVLPLLALHWAGFRFFGLPFFPYDAFDALARALPGGLITAGIESLVALVRALNLGPTAEVAKYIEGLLALALVTGMAGLGGLFIELGLGRVFSSGWWPGVIVGALFGLAALLTALAHGTAGNVVVSTLWLLLPALLWGTALGYALESSAAAPERTVRPTDRRAALAKIAAGSLGTALALWGLSFLGRTPAAAPESVGVKPSAGPLPSVPPSPAGRLEPAPGSRPEVTPNEDFYRVDINLLPVSVDGASWRLEVKGLFSKPRTLSVADLRAYPQVTEPRTLSCISNPIGGDLIGNAYWTGFRLRDLLADLGIQPEAKELLVRSVDGFYETITAADMADPRTLLIYGMNGADLPQEHGYPLRVLIPDRYGMKQPKWITRIEAMGVEQRRGYWPEREWSEDALVQIMSQVDDAQVDPANPDRVLVGGIAYTGAQGVQKVEVQVENGPWQEARLRTPPLGPLTWAQWRFEWPRTPGNWNFRVRATDGRGNLQIERRSEPHPDGATGIHVISRRV